MKKLFGRNRQYEEEQDLEDLDAVFAEEEEESYYESEGEQEFYESEAAYEGEEEIFESEAVYEGEEEIFEAEADYEGEEEIFESEAVYEGEEEIFEAEAVYEGEEEIFEAEAVYEGEEEPFEADTIYEGEEEPFEADTLGEVYGEEDYIELEDLSEGDEVYFEEDESTYEEGDEEEEILAWSAMPDKNIFQKIWYSMIHMSTMDRIITTTGVLVLILAVAVGAVFVGGRMPNKEVASYETVGTQLDGIILIGEHGLTAVADAELAKLQAAGAIEEQESEEYGEYEENEYTREVEVTLNMTSIEKDLKLKFVNSNTNKLIANVPFSVTVTTPDGKTETWTDDDMDGIIYKSNITPGSYSVAMNALTDSKYAGYTFSTAAKNVTVRKEIAYEKVDVSDEIKNESELTQKEDAENDLEVESELVDTVLWVESTVTPGKVIWTEVPRSSLDYLNISQTASAGGGIMRTAAEALLPIPVANVPAANTFTASEISTITEPPASNPDVSGGNSNNDGDNTGENGGNNSNNNDGDNSDDDDNDDDNKETTVEVTGVTLNKTTLSLAVGGTETLKAEVTPADAANKAVTWTSSNPEVATVDDNGKVTAIKAGTTTITVVANADETKKAACTVTVTDVSISITPTSLNMISGNKATVTAVVNVEGGTVTAESGAPNIAAVEKVDLSADGKPTATITVEAKAEGTTTITVTYKDKDGNVLKSQGFTVTVLAKDNKLVDKNGDQLWKKVGEDKYEEATYTDYADGAIQTFYLRTETEPRYTGWQTIGGKMYYFDVNGNKVTGEQVIQGAKYNFASDGSLVVGSGTFGIDVSKWNGTIDWNAVKNSGVSYVIIRCGYRGYGSGALVVDPCFEQNIKGATAAGIKVGVYFFSQAVNRAEAVEEASMVLQLVKNYTISYPIFLDVEYSGAAGNTGRADNLDKATRTEVIKAFCETIQNSGYTAGVYANKSWLTGMIDTSQLTKYKIWLAQYAAAPTYTGRYDMWQYKSTGRVTGINGDVDLNLSYLGY